MNTVLEMRVRAANAEMSKPGRWRIAFSQLLQAADQLVADPEAHVETIQLTLDNLHALYQWSSVMPREDFRKLNTAVLRVSSLLYRS